MSYGIEWPICSVCGILMIGDAKGALFDGFGAVCRDCVPTLKREWSVPVKLVRGRWATECGNIRTFYSPRKGRFWAPGTQGFIHAGAVRAFVAAGLFSLEGQ